MFVTADALICHAIGDYCLQSDWQATSKTQKTTAALAHAATYTMVFLALTTSWKALLFIAGTHFVIDRWRLARYVVWAKNFIAPKSAWPPPFSVCAGNGYPPDRPVWLTTWLLIIVDNLMHILLNAVALNYL